MFKDMVRTIEQNETKRFPKRTFQTVLEVGAGTGANLLALREISGVTMSAVEPNKQAFEELKATNVVDGTTMCCDWLDFPESYERWDIVFTSGVLIHVHPTRRKKFMEKIVDVADKYVVCIEYFSPEPRTFPYHGKSDALWVDDFGKMYTDMGLKLVDCKFYYKGLTWLDNLTMWVLEKV